MARRKYKDKATGVLPAQERTEVDLGTRGWYSKSTTWWAAVKSDGYYRTEDDNYANFDRHTEFTEEFRSREELEEYLKENGLVVGGTITTTVPINDWEHKPYKRTVEMPITSVEIFEKLSTRSEHSVLVSTETAGGTEQNTKFADFDTALNSRLVQDIYYRSLRKDDGGRVTVDLSELKTVMDILVK